MLQSIQYVGSGPPTYVYSDNVTSASNMFFRVFAAETSGYKSRRENKKESVEVAKSKVEKEAQDYEEIKVHEPLQKDDPQAIYQKEYGKRESFLWRLK